jgi:hypothetical protein
MVDISRPDDEAQGENSRSTNEKDIGSTSNEVCDNPISQQRTEPGTPNIPCDLMHHNVVEDDMFQKALMYQGSPSLMLQKKKVL